MFAKRFFYVCAGFLCLALPGCASTRITSQADPTARGAAYDTMMVFANFEDLELRRLGENELKAHLAARGVACHRASDVFFPGAVYTSDEARERLTALGIKAIVVVAAYDAGTTETYVPPTYYTEGTAWGSGNTVRGRATTRTVGGQTYTKPWARFQGDVFDIRTEQRTWVATARSKGNAFASWRTLLRSFCGKVAAQLTTDGVLAGTRRSVRRAPKDR